MSREFLMRIIYPFLLLSCLAMTVEAAGTNWYVAVYGEHFQLVTGISEDANVEDGEVLDLGFVGRVIYVHSEKYYELDRFRSSNRTGRDGGSAAVASEAIATANKSTKEPISMTEFGPLPDTGVQYVIDGDFHGWNCPQLYVKPLGDSIYRLRCPSEMKHE
ncbi:MAG: hypothetical protein AB2792_09780 [Candidatus Thiodiazotropha sp.]